MSERCFLAVDLGAESGRLVAGLFDGQKLRLEEVHRFSNGAVPVAGTLRWDVLRLWSEIQHSLGLAAAKYGDRIESVGVDTWGVDHVLMTRSGEILSQPYHYRDPRTNGMMEAAFSRVSRDEIYRVTGLQFMQFNSLYQLLALQKQTPQLLDIVERILLMGDFFHFLLSGSAVVEFTNATTSQLLDAVSRDWAFDLARKFQLPTRMFPEIVQPGTKLGKLRNDVAERANMKRIEVIAPATHDTGSAVASIPTEYSGTARWAYISSGTWSLMGIELPQPVLTPRALELNVTNEGGIDGTYRLLKNIMGLWIVQECRRSFERAGRSHGYGELAQQATEAPPFRAMINPDDSSFFSPADMPTALRSWCVSHGERVPESDGELVRCALEGLALKYRMVLGWLEELSGTKVEVLHVVGGGCQNELLNQFTANACGIPVVAGPVEATAYGNILVQARSVGALSSLSEMRTLVQASTSVKKYEPRDQAAWIAANQRFEELVSRA